jgi:hypothetical protein
MFWEKSKFEHQYFHQFQSPSGIKLSAHSAHSAVPPDTQSGTCSEPDRALPEAQLCGCARQPEGKVVTSRLTNHRPMRIDLEADEPVQASAVPSCPAIVVLLQDVRRKMYETNLQIRRWSCASVEQVG